MTDTLLKVDNLVRHFDVSPPWLNRVIERRPRSVVKAVDGVGFEIGRGETFSLVGESGCGKSTVARLVVGLYNPTAGSLEFDGMDISSGAARSRNRTAQRRMQMIFQDPYASLNPRWRVMDIVAEPIRFNRLVKGDAAIRERVGELLEQVGLSAADGEKYPHEFSGGQRQRIAIGRALATRPEFIVADEPVSALVSGEEGLDAILEIASTAMSVLRQDGELLVEHGAEQADAVAAILGMNGWAEIRTARDLAGDARVSIARKRQPA